jgi:hypothetical protein
MEPVAALRTSPLPQQTPPHLVALGSPLHDSGWCAAMFQHKIRPRRPVGRNTRWRFDDDDVRSTDHDLHNHDLDDLDIDLDDLDDLDDRDAFLLNR